MCGHFVFEPTPRRCDGDAGCDVMTSDLRAVTEKTNTNGHLCTHLLVITHPRLAAYYRPKLTLSVIQLKFCYCQGTPQTKLETEKKCKHRNVFVVKAIQIVFGSLCELGHCIRVTCCKEPEWWLHTLTGLLMYDDNNNNNKNNTITFKCLYNQTVCYILVVVGVIIGILEFKLSQ